MAGRKRGSSAKRVDLVAELKKAPPKPFYAIDGEERRMVDEAVAALEAAAVPAHAKDFNFDKFHAKEVPGAKIVDTAQMFPAFAERRMVLVTHAEQLDEAGQTAILRYLDNPSPTTVLALVASGKFDARKAFYKALQRAEATVRFDPPTEREMPAAVKGQAKALGIRIEDAAVRLLVEAVGTDLSSAVSALEVLELHKGPDVDRAITAEDVARVVTVTREENVFELAEAIANRDRAAVILSLHRLVGGDQAHPLQLNALVAGHYRKLLKLKAASAARISPADVGISSWLERKLAPQAARYSGRQLARCLQVVTATDRELKGGRLDPERAMERLAFALMDADA